MVFGSGLTLASGSWPPVEEELGYTDQFVLQKMLLLLLYNQVGDSGGIFSAGDPVMVL